MNKDFVRIWMAKIDRDSRINIWHKGLLMAMIQIYKEGDNQNPFQINRKKVMALAKIKGIPTYHKYMKHLQALDYIDYKPSFHPRLGSTVMLK
jgi:hypothetical protein